MKFTHLLTQNLSKELKGNATPSQAWSTQGLFSFQAVPPLPHEG